MRIRHLVEQDKQAALADIFKNILNRHVRQRQDFRRHALVNCLGAGEAIEGLFLVQSRPVMRRLSFCRAMAIACQPHNMSRPLGLAPGFEEGLPRRLAALGLRGGGLAMVTT